MDEQTGESTALAVVERICNGCGLSKPLEEFRLRYQEGTERHTNCNACFADYQRGRRLKQRCQELQDYMEQASDASNPSNYGCHSRTEAVVRAMTHRFGGLDRFAEFWFQHIDTARACGKEHIVQRSLETLARFIELTDRNKSDQPDAGLSDKNREFLKLCIVRTLFHDPDFGATVLRELGWNVEPPVEPIVRHPFGTFYNQVKSNLSDTYVGVE